MKAIENVIREYRKKWLQRVESMDNIVLKS